MNLIPLKLKCLLKSRLEKHGYSIQRTDHVQPLDMRQYGNNPISLLYHGKKQPILIDAPIISGRGLPLFTFLSSGFHPFVHAVSEALGNIDNAADTITSVLKSYFDLIGPVNANELLGLSCEEAPQLDDQPSWAAILPWDHESVGQWRKNHQASVLVENRQQGRSLTIADGWAWCGTVTEKKLQIEVSRIHSLMHSIRQKGLKRHNGSDGDIAGVVLMRQDGQWRWQARTGQHRTAALSALGFRTVPLRVIKVVNRNDVEIWPNVVSGVFTPSVALKLFDNVFNGVLPPMLQPWINHVTNHRLTAI